MSNRKSITGTFAVGQSETEVIQLNDMNLLGIVITGSYLTGTKMTFLGSEDGTNFYSVYDDTATEVSLTLASASRCHSILPQNFLPWHFIKGRLGTAASAVLQTTQPQPVKFICEDL